MVVDPAGLTFKLKLSLNGYFVLVNNNCPHPHSVSSPATASSTATHLHLGVFEHVRRDLSADVDTINRAVEAHQQRRVVGVVVGPAKHLCLDQQEEDQRVREEAADPGDIFHPLPAVHHEELAPLLVLTQDVLSILNSASAPLVGAL